MTFSNLTIIFAFPGLVLLLDLPELEALSVHQASQLSVTGLSRSQLILEISIVCLQCLYFSEQLMYETLCF